MSAWDEGSRRKQTRCISPEDAREGDSQALVAVNGLAMVMAGAMAVWLLVRWLGGE